MNLNCLAATISDPKSLTAQSLTAAKSALALAFSSPVNNSRLPKSLQKSLTTSSLASFSCSLSGASRLLSSCATALEAIALNKRDGGELTVTWCRRRHYVMQICLLTAQLVPAIVPEMPLEVDKKLCNILPLLKTALVPIQDALNLVDTLKNRIQEYGLHMGWLAVNNEDSPMVLMPDPLLSTPANKTFVQLVCMCLIHSLRLRSTPNNPALFQLSAAITSHTRGHLGWWLVQLESTHGVTSSRPQFISAARSLALSSPSPPLVNTIIDWLVRGHATLKDIYSIILRIPAPCPLPPALAHITRHPEFHINSSQAILIVLTWATTPISSNSESSPPLALTDICDWLCTHAPTLSTSEPETWSLHLAVLLVQAAHATSRIGSHEAVCSSRNERALTLLLNHLRSHHESSDPSSVDRLQAAIIMRAGCMYVQTARQLTDSLDLDNPFAPSNKYPVALIHDSVSQLVYRIIAFVDLSATASRTVFEWLIYLAHLMASSHNMDKVVRNLEIAVQVCSRASKSNSDTIHCLRRVASVATHHAYSVLDSQDHKMALSLTGIATSALEEALRLSSSRIGEMALKLAFRLELVATLETTLGNSAKAHSCIVRAIDLICEHGTLKDIANVTARYVYQQLAICDRHQGPSFQDVDGAPVRNCIANDPNSRLDPKSRISTAYPRLSALVPKHWVFAFEWRSLSGTGHQFQATLVLEAWEQGTPSDQSVARGHVLMCKAVHMEHASGADVCREAVSLLKDETSIMTGDPAIQCRTTLLACAYCYLALFSNDLTLFPIAFDLFANVVHENQLVLIDDIRWHLRRIESTLNAQSLFSQQIQLYQILLVLEKDKERGHLFTRLAEVYLELGYIGQAGHCLSTGSAYLGPDDRNRWSPVYAMYLIAKDNLAKAEVTLNDFGGSSDTSQVALINEKIIVKPNCTTEETIIASLAWIHFLYAQGMGTKALALAIKSLSVASNVSCPVFQLRVLSILSHLFSEMGIWRDAASHAKRGLRCAEKCNNLVMVRHFSALSGMVAIRKRSLHEARIALSHNLADSPNPSKFDAVDSSPALDSKVTLPVTPSPSTPGRSQKFNDTPIKENVLRFVLLGEVALLEEQEFKSLNTLNKRNIDSIAAFVNDAVSHELRARAILDELQKPTEVGELFNSRGKSIETPRLQRLLAACQDPMNTKKLQRFALVSSQAIVDRLRAAVLWSQGSKSDAAKLAIQYLHGTLPLQGPGRTQFVHDNVYIILDAIGPHLNRISLNLAKRRSATIIASGSDSDTYFCRRSLSLDNRLIDRLKFCLGHLMDTLAQMLGSAHPATIHGMITMVAYIQTIGVELGVRDLANFGLPIIHLIDQGCHGVTFCRMISMLSEKVQQKSIFDRSHGKHKKISGTGKQGKKSDQDIFREILSNKSKNSCDSRRKNSPKVPIEDELLCLRLDEQDTQPPSAIHELLHGVIPSEWVVCQLTVDTERNVLYLAVCTKAENVLLSLPVCRAANRGLSDADSGTYTSTRSTLDLILAENDSMLKNEYETRDEKQKWWDKREQLDKDIYSVMVKLDQQWLGCFRGLMYAVPHPASELFVGLLNKFFGSWLPEVEWSLHLSNIVVHGWLALGHSLTSADLDDISHFILDECFRQGMHDVAVDKNALPQVNDIRGFISSTLLEIQKDFPAISSAKHTVLVLDKNAHVFPWESSLSLRGKSVSRVFSINSLVRLLSNSHASASRDSVYYVINPDGDLGRSQDVFDPIIRKHPSWSGQSGRSPSESSFLNELASHDVFLYCGHNGGEKLCPPKHILHQSAGPKVVFLMGCSSGKLSAPGEYDPMGVPMYYSTNSQAVVCNLWDVTDIDIDRFTVAAMVQWGLVSPTLLPTHLMSDKGLERTLIPELPRNKLHIRYDASASPLLNHRNRTSVKIGGHHRLQLALTSAVARARDACRFKYLVGAAPVVFGIPVDLHD